ncbi:MAG: choice-of-anchor L domain-containing protein [Bacteroidetes bacterium]|nr:choice-of-anchor L domain-containing protein [Bacteroidota bacterium]
MKKYLSKLLSTALLLILSFQTKAQLIVNTTQTPLQMAQKIAGQGVKILNPTIVCGANGYGSYTATATNLGSNAGVILTSGLAADAIGPNNVGNKSVQVGTAGDPQLNAVTGRTTFDACTFEFDIIPEGDTLKFDYVFASEEYPEWVNSQFNDVFGFFISGPGIVGSKNIAIIPGGAPCTINTVNNGTNNTGPCTNCAYYVDNQTVPGQTIQYDGFTKNLTAISAVQPCQTYHLKLVIADASDRKWDSGVFIEQIESNNVTISYATLNSLPQMIEGCNPATVTFTRFPVNNKTLTVPFSFGGSAIKNTDYTVSNVGTTVFFPANVATASFVITPINDGLNEGIEGVTVYIGNPLCAGNPPTDSLKIEIHDSLYVTINPPRDSICPGQSVQLTTTTSGLTFNWLPTTGLNSPSIKNPIASPTTTTTYTLTTTAGACSNIRRSTIKVSDINLNAVPTNILCNGQTTGSVILNPTGGLGTYSYSWNTPPVTSKDITGKGPGNYTVTVTDSKGCTKTGSFTLTQPDILNGNLNSPTVIGGFNIACNGSSTGSITTNPSGGTPPYTYTWTGPGGFSSNLQSPTGLAAGTYCVTVRDVNGCTNGVGGQCVTLTQPNGNLTATVSSSAPVSCFGQANGTATAVASGGTAPYTYTWNSSPIQNTATATNLSPNTYTITIRDINACVATNTVTITQPSAALSAAITSQTNVFCNGGATGSATVTPSGGTLPYTYTWSNGQFTQTATGLAAGTYNVVVKDVRNCSATVPVVITQPTTALGASITAQSNVLCKGEASGSATAAGSGGSGAYTYSWSNGQLTATATGLAAGVYSVNVFDNNGCTVPVNLSVTITEPALVFSAVLGPKNNVLCKGECNGSATVNASGGSGSYTYTWTTTPVQNTATASNLCAGSYQVTVRDANGCATPVVINVSITEPTNALGGTISNTNISCFGGSNGTVTVSPTGGSGVYDYSWNGPGGAFVNNSPNASGLIAGVYTVQVFDRNGCTVPFVLQATITQPSGALAVSIPSHTDNTCFGGNAGTATAVITGGSGIYTISWNSTPSQSGLTATGLASGNYTVFVNDNNGCSTQVSASVTITQPTSALSATTSQTNVACNGGATGVATAIASGGSGAYTYSWVPGAATTASITNLTIGTYTVYVRDANNCPTPVVQSVTITQPSVALGGSIVSSTDILCFGTSTGSATAQGTGGSGAYNYTWSNGQTGATATNLAVGTYTVTIRDNNGCTNTVVLSVIITQPSSALAAVINPGNITAVSCFGNNDGQIIVTASGGSGVYDYSWSGPGGPFVNNAAVAANLIAGNYTVQVFDHNGCATPIVLNATITQPIGNLTATATTTNFNSFSIACYGGTTNINLAVSGGNPAYTYTWSGPSTFTSSIEDLTGVAAGLYSVIVSDTKGCSTTTSITLTEPSDDSLSFVMTSAPCAGGNTGAINITPFGGVTPYTYNWNGPSVVNVTTQDLTGLDNGFYTVIITDANNCKDTTVVTVTQPSSLTTNHTNSTYPGGFQVQCNGGNNGFINTTTSGGTPPYVRTWVKTNPPGVISATTANISSLTAATYELIITDQNGCIDNELVILTEPDSITSNLAVSSIVTCNGTTTGCLSTNVSGGVPPYNYVWSGPGSPFPSTPSICNAGAGSYTVAITDASGCSNPNLEHQIVLTQPAVLTANAAIQTGILCNNQPTGAINLTVSGGSAPYTYTWTGPGGYTASTEDIFGLAAGLYSVTVRDTNLCSVTTSITLTQPDPIVPIANIPNPNGFNIACFGGNNGSIALSVTGGTGVFTYLWSGTGAPFGNVSSISNLVAGTYTVRVSDSNGCFTSDTSFTLTQPTQLFVIDSVVTLSGCNGAAGGSIKALATGGVGSYTYTWNTVPQQLTQTAVNLVGGSYTVTVKDGNNCSAQATANIPTLPPLDSTLVSSSITNVLCNGALTGAITLSVNGGLAPFTYNWVPASIGNIPNPSGLPAGFYSVVITDANNCSTTPIHYEITQPAALNLSFTGITNVNCFGGVNGTINASVTGGVGNYNYTWSGACVGCPNSPNLSGLTAGIYNLTVSDDNACTVSGVDSITQPVSNLSASASSPVVNGGYNITCNGASTGNINLVVTGGTGPYTFTWTAAGFATAFTQNLSGLKAKTYTVVVVDNKGCTTSTSITLTQPPLLVLNTTERTFIGGNNISCNGAQDGCIDATVSGGTSPYTYSWTGPNGYNSTSEDICNLFAGLYILTATDANGCEVFKAVTLTEPDPLAGSLAPSFFNGGWNIGCNGDSTGFITLTVTGGTSGYEFIWSTADTTQDIFNLPAGGYNVLVTDPNGCEFRDSISLYEPPVLLASIISPEFIGGWNISCFGFNNGVDSLDVQGGTPAYNFNWVGPGGFTSSNEDISGLFAGIYTATITDDNGCILIKTDTLTEPPALDFTLSSPTFIGGNNISCYGDSSGSITSTVTGGTTLYSYTWNGPNVTNIHTSSLTNLVAGNYVLTVTDTNGCNLTKNILLTQPTPLSTQVIPTVVAGGFNITCRGTNTGVITVIDGGGTAPYTYTWTDSAGTVIANTANIDSLYAGTYTIAVADANGCDTLVSVTLTEPLELNDTITSPVFIGGTSLRCFNDNSGSIIITEVGGAPPFNHAWSGPGGFIASNDTLTGLAAGSYSVLITDANGCTKTDSIVLTQPAALALTLVPTVYVNGLNIRCFNDSSGVIIANISGGTQGYSYSWIGPNGFTATTKDLIGVVAGQYCLTVTDTNGCSVNQCQTLTQPTSALSGILSSPLLAGGFNVSCNGSNDGTIYLSFSGGSPGFTIDWRGPNGFSDSAVFASATNDTLFNLYAGTYTVVMLDTNTCAYTDSITLTEPANPIVGVLTPFVYPGGNNVTCFGSSDGAIDLSVTGGIAPYTYSWSTSAVTQDISNLSAGIYTVTITDSINCFKSYSDTLVQPDTISSNLLAQVYAGGFNITCNGFSNGAVNSSYTGGTIGFTFGWTGPGGFSSTSQNISGVPKGTYCLVVRDTNGCVSNQKCITLIEPNTVSLIETHPPVDCSYLPSNISLSVTGGTSPYSYSWTGPGITAADTTNSISGLLSGNYSVTVVDGNSCVTTLAAPVVIYVPDSLRINLSAVTFPPANYNISNFGLSDGVITTIVTGGTLNYTYSWSNIEGTFSSASQNLSTMPKGVYIVTVTDAYNCALSDTIELREPYELQMPSGFSPNGDGLNDDFYVHGLDVYPDNVIVVFNRWGNQVYTKDSYYRDWTGLSDKGEPLPDGTYVVVLKIKNSDIILKGYVDLRRN